MPPVAHGKILARARAGRQRHRFMNRTDRLVAMVLYLQGRRVVRAAELAEHFEVTERTVYRDVAALSEAGVPIAGEAGVGYTLMKGYHLPPVMFTAEEASSLFVGGELVKGFTDPSLHAPMTTALDKLRAVLPRESQDHVDRLVRSTVVMGKGFGPNQDPATQPMLLPVQQGVVQRRVLRLTYRGNSRADETDRDVEPLGVVFYGGAWYLVAWCRLRVDLRHFRIDRIRRLELRSERFAARPDFNLVEHLKQNSDQRDTLPARVWFARNVQERARRESYATLVEECQRDGGTEFSLYTYSLEWMARWILSFGTCAEAVAPAKLRELVRTEAGRIAQRHA
jgi:predicted DNA-binding transcriptional regulator YafY